MLNLFNATNKQARRSNRLGHVLVSILALIFLSVFVINIYQFDFWQHYFFADSYSLENDCKRSTAIVEKQGFSLAELKAGLKPVAMPHSLESAIKEKIPSGKVGYVYYHCLVETENFLNREGVINMHLGWIYGDSAVVSVNGSERAFAHGTDKLVIPFTRSDLDRPVQSIEVLVEARKVSYVGFIGKAPFVIAENLMKNSKLFGLETALQQLRYLAGLMPVVTMGFILLLGWIGGVRSRFMVVTFFYFVMLGCVNLILYTDYLTPWRSDSSYMLSRPFYFGSAIGLAAFGMELLGVWRRRITPILYLTIVVVAVLAATLFFLKEPRFLAAFIGDEIYFSTLVTVCSALIIFGWRQLRRENLDPARRRVNQIFLLSVAVILFLTVLDVVFSYLQIPIRLTRKTDTIMPFFIGGILLYTLALIERSYRREKVKREKMEHDLELAREIQDSLAPPPPETKFGDFHVSYYQLKHSQVAGDWMAVRHSGENDEELFIVVADVTGKGVQAALVVHAIQSMWAEALGRKVFNPEKWVPKLNRTLVRLGERRPHSATLGIIKITEQTLTYWNLGHTPAFIVTNVNGRQKVRSITARGSVLGVHEDLKYTTEEVAIEPGHSFHLLLGSDGVFANGSRTRPREVTALLTHVQEKGKDSLLTCDEDDDRTLVYLSRQDVA